VRQPLGERLYIQDVEVRDGFQIEPSLVWTEQKIALIDAARGLTDIVGHDAPEQVMKSGVSSSRFSLPASHV
jgi:hypothetical protein